MMETHILPRGTDGGIILSGCRPKKNWNGEVEPELAEVIETRGCALASEVGRPQDLQIISLGLGLRRSTMSVFAHLRSREAQAYGTPVETGDLSLVNMIHARAVCRTPGRR